ncbi:sensor domain-containing protein [Sphingomonas nostoxanthinifaciens]|uniref:sensor domain-containing protein n=1 Tax=Sphingomonas nostoxanthinifaciens TaxID=2872652 RepID=UPI001CC1F74E|nr:EAL domain-containing protein [Sphingomonas nostoxanthinifaciens]UAK25285.1 EAL domain-containing protein [Sphingomonas nostoxanthinifaciens]
MAEHLNSTGSSEGADAPKCDTVGELDRFEQTFWRSEVAFAHKLDPLASEIPDDKVFRMLADNIPTLCWIANGDGYIVWYNRRWHEYCGTTPKDMEGWGWKAVHDPELLPSVMSAWTDAIATAQPFEMTFPLLGKDGVFRPFLTRIQPVRDSSGAVARWFGVNTEITAQKSAEKALSSERDLLRAFLDAIPGVLYAKDQAGRMRAANNGTSDLIGKPQSFFIGKTDAEYLDDKEQAAVIMENDRRIMASGVAEQIEEEVRKPDGEPAIWLSSKTPWRNAAGEVIGVIGSSLDITSRRKTEDRLARINAELELRNIILQMIAHGEALTAIADRLCREVERIFPDVLCSVLSVDPAGKVHPIGGPSLPNGFAQALDGQAIGPDCGTCGTAAYLNSPVVTIDISTDQRWAKYRDFGISGELQACWSSPIPNGKGQVVGTFAFYYREQRGPSFFEQDIVRTLVSLCAIALEHDRWQAEKEYKANVDQLTGLRNRASFDASLVLLQDADWTSWGLLIVDLDNLKFVNDTFGHKAGDCLLRVVAKRLGALSHADRAYRLGGDEFAIIADFSSARGDLDAVATAVFEALAAPCNCEGHTVLPRATIGGAVPSDRTESPEQVRQNADFALYHAKESGRGLFERYHPGIRTKIMRRLAAIRDVDIALDEGRIHAFYQPVVRLDTREIVGFEALCRMTVGDRIVSAAEFHEATTDVHVAARLTGHMMDLVAADIRRWLDMGIPFQHVGINVSSADISGGNVCDRLIKTFGRADVPFDHVIIEVTESVYMGGRDQNVANTLKQLRDKGVRVALDDFGTGFASLTHLMTVPVDILKIDKSFVDRLTPGDAGEVIIEGVNRIATQLGIRVIAEGIETEVQASHVEQIGCALGQGYLFSRAVDRDAATALLLANAQYIPRGSASKYDPGREPARGRSADR